MSPWVFCLSGLINIGVCVCCRAVLIMLSFGVTTSLLAFVPPFAAGQFAIFGIQVMLALH